MAQRESIEEGILENPVRPHVLCPDASEREKACDREGGLGVGEDHPPDGAGDHPPKGPGYRRSIEARHLLPAPL